MAKPLEEKEVVIVVPKGETGHVKVVEAAEHATHEIIVQVSKKRRPTNIPVLGVMVK